MAGPAVAILALVTLQRAAELAWGRRNEAALRDEGGYEAGAGHYRIIVALHVAWLGGLWILGWDRPVNPWFLSFYLLLQMARAWVLATLGRRWTTRIIVLPGERLVISGPYRYMRHPNYAVVAAEIVCLPLVFGLWWYAAVFGTLNLALLHVRRSAEDAALATLRGEVANRKQDDPPV